MQVIIIVLLIIIISIEYARYTEQVKISKWLKRDYRLMRTAVYDIFTLFARDYDYVMEHSDTEGRWAVDRMKNLITMHTENIDNYM